MNADTRFLTTSLLSLVAFSLAACGDALTAPNARPAARISNADAAAPRTSAAWFSAVAASSQEVGHFQIEVIPADTGGETVLATVRMAAARWVRILRETELPDIRFGEGPKPDCLGLRLDHRPRVVDDLAILVSARRVDGVGGMLANSAPCWVRWESSLPYLGALILDRADIEDLDARDLRDLVAHEIGHLLGIGSLWGNFGLLRNPSRFAPGVDTHFEGSLAIAAFDAAGGAGYLHGKVPVENLMGPGSADVHWRESVLGSELMTPVLTRRESHPLSAITIQSLSDLGYTVDLARAEAFVLPEPGGSGGSGERDHDRALSLAGDVQTAPLLALDTERGVVRVLRR